MHSRASGASSALGPQRRWQQVSPDWRRKQSTSSDLKTTNQRVYLPCTLINDIKVNVRPSSIFLIIKMLIFYLE